MQQSESTKGIEDLYDYLTRLASDKYASIIQLLIMSSVAVFGFVAWYFGGKSYEWALGLTTGAVLSLIPIAYPLFSQILKDRKDLRGVKRVVRRGSSQDQIYRYLLPELKEAKIISCLGNILLSDFLRNRNVFTALANNSSRELRLRICIYMPKRENRFLQERARDEIIEKFFMNSSANQLVTSQEQLVEHSLKHMIDDLKGSLREILKLRETLGAKLQLGLLSSAGIYDSILIADSKVVVVDYLHQTGTGAPVLVLKHSPVSTAYEREFERMWCIAQKVDNDAFEPTVLTIIEQAV